MFSAVSAAREVQRLKARKWTEPKVLELIASLARVKPLAKLAEPARAFVLSLVTEHIRSPLSRTFVLETGVSSLLNPQQLMVLMLKTGEREMAASVAKPPPENVMPTPLWLLSLETSVLSFRGFDPACLDEKNWALVFDMALKERNAELALALWPLKTKFRDPPVNADMLLRFVQLVANNKNTGFVKQACSMGVDCNSDYLLFTAMLRCFKNWRELYAVLGRAEMLWPKAKTVNVSGCTEPSELLAGHVREVLKYASTNRMPSLVGDLLLEGLYRRHTSRTVLTVYRMLVSSCQFEPTERTARLLARTAYRLGNSKLLMHAIYMELKPASRQFFETWLACQYVGSGYRGALYVLAEMARRRIALRRSVQRTLFHKFSTLGDTAPLQELARPRFAERYLAFDAALALRESPNQQQAERNALSFLESGDLDKMLSYDERKAQREARH